MDLDVCYTSLYIQLISKEIICETHMEFLLCIWKKKIKISKPVDYSGDFSLFQDVCVFSDVKCSLPDHFILTVICIYLICLTTLNLLV